MLKATTFVALLVPGMIEAIRYSFGLLGARPLTALLQATGLWAIRFLFVALAITPARQIFGMPRLMLVRRMLGVAASGYAAIHLGVFAADKMFDLATVASEIALRAYLGVGALALALLSGLAAISTDAMIHRLGTRRWQMLQRSVYAIGVIAVLHFFMQSRINAAEPTVMAGLLMWLLGYRILYWRGGTRLATSRSALLGLAGAAGLLTAFGEASYFALFTGIDPVQVLAADLSLAGGLRPAWIVAAIALGIVALAMARDSLERLVMRPYSP